MAYKRNLTDSERYGLSTEEVKIAERYLRKNTTAGTIPDTEALKLFEMYLIGSSFPELSQHFPQYPIDSIILTAALKGWAHDRDKAMLTMRDRIRAKVVKSVIDQVDFLTAMLSVTNAEHMNAMHKFMMDPTNNPKPTMRITSVKEYKDVIETLHKIVAGSTAGPNNKASPMFDALTDPTTPNKNQKPQQVEDFSAADIIANEIESTDE